MAQRNVDVGVQPVQNVLDATRFLLALHGHRSIATSGAGVILAAVATAGDLASRDCVPCEGGTPPLAGAELESLLAQVGGDWRVVEGHHLEKTYRFKNFRDALDFVNRVGELAEEQNHHPDLLLAWGRVRITIFTHTVDGLSESDFVFAAKADARL